MKKLSNGQWECIVNEKENLAVVAATKEEAQRMAEAYRKGDTTVVRKRIERKAVEKSRTALLD